MTEGEAGSAAQPTPDPTAAEAFAWALATGARLSVVLGLSEIEWLEEAVRARREAVQACAPKRTHATMPTTTE